MAENIIDDDFHVDSFSVITSFVKINAIQVRLLLLEHWDRLTQQMSNCSLLFIGGVHGNEKGQIVGVTGSSITMANQVITLFIVSRIFVLVPNVYLYSSIFLI